MKILRVLGLLVLIGLGFLAWPAVRDWRHGYVQPTALRLGETPMAALCRIRTEFLALPNPAYDGFTLHARWERRRLGAPTERFGPFWEIDQAWSAWRFARRYSRLEIVAAVGPYMSDPQLAPKATAILAGLPVHHREHLDQVQGVSILLAEPDKLLPEARAAAPWSDAQLQLAQASLAALYGEPNSADRLRQDPVRTHPDTLEGALMEIIAASDALSGPQFEPVDTSAYTDFESARAQVLPPAPRPSFQAFLQRWPRELLATALFPMALGSQRERYIRFMGQEAVYWPLHADKPLANEAAHASAYRRETGEFARSLCHGAQPRKL